MSALPSWRARFAAAALAPLGSMPRGHGLIPGLFALSALLLGCGDLVDVPVRLTHAPEQEPLLDAAELVFSLEQGGVVLLEQRFGPDPAALDLGPLSYGTNFRLRLEIFTSGGHLWSRGRSLPFDVLEGEPAPRVDLHLGLTGRFSDAGIAPPDGRIVGLAATPEGALVATAAGSLFTYVHHAPADGRPRLVWLFTDPSLSGASWIDAGSARMLAVGGVPPGARLFDADGTLLAERVDGSLGEQATDLVLTRLSGGALALGGAPAPAMAPSALVRRIHIDGSEIRIETLPPLPCAVSAAWAEALTLLVSIRDQDAPRALLPCAEAGASTTFLLVDPLDPSSAVTAQLDGDRRSAALIPILEGFVAIAGGRDALGAVSAEVSVLAVSSAALSPTTALNLDPLSTPRAHAAGHALGGRRALLVGGLDASGAPLESAELLVVAERGLVTGHLPAPAGAPRMIRLLDGTVLVAGEGGFGDYVPTVDPERRVQP
ncbi:MAG: hypothetical protein OEY14_10605 [Myxococcales bacterium]|nr:hypothetical protein [Myxococcales bacterium]